MKKDKQQQNTRQHLKVKSVVNTCSLPDANPGLSSGQAATAPVSALGAPTPGDLIPGASPRKKPRKQQHVISTEESEMVETNSTDEEKAPGRPVSVRSERRESPPREYVGACRSIVP